jgi:hypothetical protein
MNEGLLLGITPLNIGIGVATLLVFVAANSVLQGAVIHGTVSDLAGRPASFGESLGAGIRFILPLIGVGIVAGLSIAMASVLFVIPGVLVALAWAVGAPVEVMERRGVFGSLNRSADLTRDNRLAIFGLAVIYFVVFWAAQWLETGLTRSFVRLTLSTAATQNLSSLEIVQTTANVIFQTVTALVSSAGVASIYYELRSIKDGVGAEELAAVFD